MHIWFQEALGYLEKWVYNNLKGGGGTFSPMGPLTKTKTIHLNHAYTKGRKRRKNLPSLISIKHNLIFWQYWYLHIIFVFVSTTRFIIVYIYVKISEIWPYKHKSLKI